MTISIPCSHHPQRGSQWRCPACRTTLCGDCVRAYAIVAGEGFASCRACGGKCERVSVLGDDPERKREREDEASLPFHQRLRRMWNYPFRGEGWALVAAGAGTIWVLSMAGQFIPFLPWLLIWLMTLYIGAYGLAVIEDSAAGETLPPDWPDFGNLWDDILWPNIQVWFTAAVCFGPAFVSSLTVEEGVDGLSLVLLFAGSVYYPMALVSVVLSGSLLGVNPVTVIPALVKTAGDYAIVCVTMVVISLGTWWVEWLFERVPFVGSLLGAASMVYLTMFQSHLMGSLYHANRVRIGWFEGSERPRTVRGREGDGAGRVKGEMEAEKVSASIGAGKAATKGDEIIDLSEVAEEVSGPTDSPRA